MENLRNRIDLILKNNEKKLLKMDIRTNWVGMQKRKVTLPFNKPVIAGISILDLREVSIYGFHYEQYLI